MQREIDIGGADVRHFRLAQQEPRYGATDDGELALEAAEDLADLDQDALDCGGGPVIVVVRGTAQTQLNSNRFSLAILADLDEKRVCSSYALSASPE